MIADGERQLNSAGNRRGMHPNSRRSLDQYRDDPRVLEAGLANFELGRLSAPQALRRLGWRKRADPEVAAWMCRFREERQEDLYRVLERLIERAAGFEDGKGVSPEQQMQAWRVLDRHVWR